MMKNVLLALLFSFGSFYLKAQNGSIEGIVMQMDSSGSVPGVNIYLDETKYGAITNGQGMYKISNVPEGTYILVVSNVGYRIIKKEIKIKANETLKEDFSIIESIASLGEIVVMTKGNTGLKDIPGSVQYISPKEIQKFNYTDINRTLRAVPGINIQEEDGFGLRPNIGLRGTGVERSSKITIMEDGVLMAPAPYADPAAYYFPTIGRMAGVEILKGSSQIKYGPFTTGGAINLISTPIPETFAGRINLFGGSYGSRNVHANVGNTYQNIAFLVETFQYGSNGFKELDGDGNTGFDKKDYLAKLRVNTNPKANIYQSLTFKVGQTTETSNETYLGLTEDDYTLHPYRRYVSSKKDVMKTAQTQFSLTHFIRLTSSLSINTTAYHTDFARNWYKLDKVKNSDGANVSIADLLDNPGNYGDAYAILTGATSTNPNALLVRANNRAYEAQGIQTVMTLNVSNNQINHSIDVGLRYHRDEVDRFQWEDEYAMVNAEMQLTKSGTPGTESNRVKSAEAFASYVQYKLKFDKCTIIPGIRYENIMMDEKEYGKNDPQRIGTNLVENRNHVAVYIPGIGLDYQFNRYLSTFAGVHKGFSPPGPKDETEPEESINYEVGVRYTKNSLSGQAVLFYNNYSNLLGSDLAAAGGGGTGDLFNGGEVKAKGLEFQLTYDLLSQGNHSKFSLPISIVYTYTDAFFENSFVSSFEGWGTVVAGDEFPYLAHNQLAIVVGLEHRKFSVNISGRYMDEMRTEPGQGEVPFNEKTDSYFVIDASANFDIDHHVSLFATVTNITDQLYIVARRPAGLRPGMPRAFIVGVKANF